MAIPRMFNSNTPFTISTGESRLSFQGKEEDGPGGGGQEEQESLKESLVQAIGPHLDRVMLLGTAKHLVAPGNGQAQLSIVAQAEREDFQEFSPTNTQCPYARAQLLNKIRSITMETVLSDTEHQDLDLDLDLDLEAKPLQHHYRKQRRKPRSRSPGSGDRAPVIQGLWVQEIDWLKSGCRATAHIIPPPPQFTDERSGVSDSDYGLDQDQDSGSVCSDSDSSCEDAADGLNLTFGLMQVSGFTSSDSTGCIQSPLSDSSSGEISQHALGVDDLRGKVTRLPKLLALPFLSEFIRRCVNDTDANEGLVFHHQLQPSSCRYREGEEYRVLHHVQNGSYGDVFCVRDRSSGFRCAAKRIPVSVFSGEEVITWSALCSPRVVELFGAVRDGPNMVLFMELKPACLSQLLRAMGALPEDLALHYLHQALEALEHLHHRRVLHLDVKVDNVLLSADCRDTFLCDFGLSETLDDKGRSSNAFRGAVLPGSETHMAPEVARGGPRCSKADVWSSCCMLLHMLTGCPPWIRHYSPPLCLHIVNEPPPLWEVPSNCNNFTAKVFRAGLQKEPERRASAAALRRKTTKALRAVGGLSPWSVRRACEKLHGDQDQTQDQDQDQVQVQVQDQDGPCSLSAMHWVSPWRTSAVDEDSSDWRFGDSDLDLDLDLDSETRDLESSPRSLLEDYDVDVWDDFSDSEVDIYMAEEEIQERWPRSDQDYEGDWEEEEEEEEEEDEEWDSSSSSDFLRTLRGVFPLLQRGRRSNDDPSGSEPELKFLRDDVAFGTKIQTPSPEPRDEPPSCFSCSETSQIDDSEKDSDHSSDDLSSGVFSSCNSRADGHLEWSASANQPSSHCFEGVDIWIENVQGQCLRIRERRQVKVGHVAIGISDQVSGKPFTLETLDRKCVCFEQQITESCLWLRCVPAPDRCQRWSWRVRDGKLELRE